MIIGYRLLLLLLLLLSGITVGFADAGQPVREGAQPEDVREVILVDGYIEDAELLISELRARYTGRPGLDIVMLERSKNGIEQMTAALAGYHDLSGIHLISHGATAQLHIGGNVLTRDNIAGYDVQLGQWGKALAEDGDIMLYGCRVANSAAGTELMQSLGRLTGADVAASTDDTGPVNQAADWQLEYQTGAIDIAALDGETVQHYPHILAPPLIVSLNNPNNATQVDTDGAGNGSLGLQATWIHGVGANVITVGGVPARLVGTIIQQTTAQDNFFGVVVDDPFIRTDDGGVFDDMAVRWEVFDAATGLTPLLFDARIALNDIDGTDDQAGVDPLGTPGSIENESVLFTCNNLTGLDSLEVTPDTQLRVDFSANADQARFVGTDDFNGQPFSAVIARWTDVNSFVVERTGNPGFQLAFDGDGDIADPVDPVPIICGDHGDAPDTYSTDYVPANSVFGTDLRGVTHRVIPGIQLGAIAADFELDSAGNGTANIDDITLGDDEDGVNAFTNVVASPATTTYSVILSAVNNPTAGVDPNAIVYGWVDFDRNGTFQTDEIATASVADGGTGATLTWNNIGTSGPNILAGSTYARFRITTDTLTDDGGTAAVDERAAGRAENGEVEDYALTIQASIVVNDVAVSESAGTATVTISLEAASNQIVTVDYASADNTAIVTADYSAVSGMATFNPGTTTATVVIPINDDTLDEALETFFINLSNASANAVIADNQGQVSILDDDPAPVLSITDVTVNENAGTATLTVSTPNSAGSAFSVDFTTTNGTATAGADYTATSGTLTFPAGSTSQTIDIAITDDLLDELDETFTVDLSNPVGATIADNQGQVTITDNDLSPGISINDVTVSEADGNAVFTISLGAVSGLPVSVDVTTTAGSAGAGVDYTTTTQTVTIPAGSASANFSVPLLNDDLDELDETFTVDLSNPLNSTIADNQALGTITDDDPPPALSVNDISVAEDAGNAVFTVSLSAVSALPVTVDVTTGDASAGAGSDYTTTTQTVTIPAGSTSATINVPISDDALDEPSETFTLDLSNPGNATIADNQGVATITDNDNPPGVTIADITVDEAAGTATLTISIPTPSGQPISVDYTTVDGTATLPADYTAGSATATIAAGATSTTITIPIVNDALDELDEAFTVDLSNPVNTIITDGEAIVTITDNDPPPSATINDVTIDEAAGTAVFTVTLNAPSALPVSLGFASANGTASAPGDYDTVSGTLTIPPGNTSATITVPIIEDTLDELNETFTIDLSAPGNVVISDAQGVATITDNDPTPALSINDVTINEADGTATLTVTIPTASGLDIDVDFTTTDDSAAQPGDYTTTLGTLTLPAGTTSGTIVVPITDDLLNEAQESFNVDLSNPVNATLGDNLGIVTIDDDDAAPGIAIADLSVDEAAGVATLTISIPAPSALDIDVDYTTNDGSGLSGALAGLDYTLSSGTATIPAGSTSVTIAIPIDNDALDELDETFTVDLSNPANAAISDSQAVVTITDNDPPPNIVSIDDVTIDEGAGTAIFTVTLDVPSGLDVSADFITTDITAGAPGDYTTSGGTLTIPAGSTTGTIVVPIIDDALDEAAETFSIDVSNPVNVVIIDNQGIATITDDDPPPLLSIANTTVSESDGSIIVTLTLDAPSALPVSVDFTTTDGSAGAAGDYGDVNGTLTIPPGQTTTTITIPITDDAVFELSEVFTIDLSNPVNTTLNTPQATVTINDDDLAPDSDGDGVANFEDIDDDNDGIPDVVEAATALNGGDTDGDGIPDSLDLDSDGDGIPDLDEGGLSPAQIAALDTDNDGVIDPGNSFGANGLADALETAADTGTLNYPIADTDGDGHPDFQDLDSDNDGINDLIEAGLNPLLVDPNGDGLVDGTDADGDGIADLADDTTGFGGLNPPLPDTDGDGAPDFQDLDSDNDGIDDLIEGGLDPAVADANGDGIVDGPDTDQDGIQDPADGAPATYGDLGSGPAPNNDSDPVPDYLDLDSDNDGINDVVEGGNSALDSNGDGTIDGVDSDGDGILDPADPLVGFGDDGVMPPPNTDGTDTPDYIDLDSDNDGINDVVESGNGALDADGDGQIDGIDSDGDGIIDAVDAVDGFGGGQLITIPALAPWAMAMLLLLLVMVGGRIRRR